MTAIDKIPDGSLYARYIQSSKRFAGTSTKT
jgi:hypothetical protein